VKFLLDHDVPDDAGFSLEALGHVVVKLREVLPVTTPDDEVLRLAGERNSVLITCNRDDFLAAAGRAAHHRIIGIGSTWFRASATGEPSEAHSVCGAKDVPQAAGNAQARGRTFFRCT
jgi:hypothetical protein